MSQVGAADMVMELLLDGEDDKISQKLLAQAVMHGLSRRFSFYVGQVYEAVEDDSKVQYGAFIYPTGEDSTFKAPAIIRPMVPGVRSVDACMETEWYFPEGKDTPAQIAKFLSDRGFIWDKEMQQKLDDPKAFKEVQAALEAPKAPAKKKLPNICNRRGPGGFAGPR